MPEASRGPGCRGVVFCVNSLIYGSPWSALALSRTNTYYSGLEETTVLRIGKCPDKNTRDVPELKRGEARGRQQLCSRRLPIYELITVVYRVAVRQQNLFHRKQDNSCHTLQCCQEVKEILKHMPVRTQSYAQACWQEADKSNY